MRYGIEEELDQFMTPETTSEAYSLGFRSSRAGRGRIAMGRFYAAGDVTEDNNPYWRSLWNAYQKGRKDGRKCPDCRRSFKTPGGLRTHRIHVHGYPQGSSPSSTGEPSA